MGAGRRSQGIEQELKAKIRFNSNVFVVYFSIPISFETFCTRTLEACQLSTDTKVTIKVIDDEGDPCTVLSQNDLDEVIWSVTEAHATEIFVHVFLGKPLAAGAPCAGEDKNVYRRGARRWKKIYKVFGHDFEPKRTNKRTNCALCHDNIWGIGRGGLRCTACGMFVHKKCHKFVRRPCTRESGNYPHSPSTPNFTHQQQLINSMYASSPQTMNGANGQENRIELNRGNFGGNGLEDFRLLTVIGRGSYAKVIQAEHRKTGEIFAIKIVKKTMCAEEEDLDWIQTEKSVFETASNHPFLVGLHSCFQSDSRLFFVIEFIPGGDLMFHMQKQQRLAEDHARFYSAEIILALHFLHSRSIVYRDLKLDNVLLDQYGHIKLTDFGMCKENIGPGDCTNTFCGVCKAHNSILTQFTSLFENLLNGNMSTFLTPNYIAPEILRGEEYGFSVDYWALGVLMFEMMAGRSPFNVPGGEDEYNAEDKLFQVILERQIRIPRNLTVRAANVLKGFLNKDPQLRLGCKLDIDEGLNDIKNNAFFKEHIDWTALERRQVIPPFKPDVENERDLSRFDTSFTGEAPTLTPDDPDEIARIDQSEFEGFEFVNPLQLGREDVV